MTTFSGRSAQRRALLLRVINRFSTTILWRWLLRLLEIEFLDRATAIAARAFVALVPLVAVVIVVLPDGVSNAWITSTTATLGMPNDDLDALASIESARATFGIVGGLALVFYATSFGTSLQRLYRRAWRRQAIVEGNRWKVLEWLAVFVLYSTMVTFVEFALADAGAELLARVAVVAGGTILWTWTARILLGREVRWRALWFGGLITQVALSAYSTASLVWVPRTLNANEGAFGAYGVALTMLAWLIGCAFIIVVAAALPPVLADTPHRFARLLSGHDPLEAHAAPPLPPPATSPLRMWWSGAPVDAE
jgi:membrane protein